jgi:sulfonate transport system substrate-binding protein
MTTIHLKRRTTILLTAALLLSALVLQACGGGSNKEGGAAAASASGDAAGDVPSVLTYGYIGVNDLNLPTGAEGWGFHTGIIQEELKKYGITEVKLVAFPNGPDQSESLISGRIDFGSLGDTPAILARSTGAPSRLIVQPSTDSIGYLIGKKDGPKTVKELAGKTIAIQKGSFMHRYVVGLLEQEGVKDYKLVHMLRPDGEAALARGEVDAMTNTGVNALKQIDQGFVHLDDAYKHPDLVGTSATVVSEKYLAKFPDFPKVWNEIREKALADLQQHEQEYYELVAQIQQTTPELVERVSPVSIFKDTAFTDEGIALLEGTKNFLVKEKLADKDFDIQDWILRAE